MPVTTSEWRSTATSTDGRQSTSRATARHWCAQSSPLAFRSSSCWPSMAIVAWSAGGTTDTVMANRVGGAWLNALADRAHGEVLLAQGDPQSACAALRQALLRWHELEAPYEAARTRVLLGRACRQLSDADGAALEFAAAQQAFEYLGAAADLADLLRAVQPQSTGTSSPLTAREMQVLRLLASGAGNRAIAAELVLSERTVARHVSNIFDKLGLSSRAAATAYAYQHGLVQSST